MSTITTRAGKGSPLTNAELDANFTALNSDKMEKSANLSDLANVATARSNLGLVIGSTVQAFDADLAAIAGLSGTSGFLKKTAADTWALDTNTYLTSVSWGIITGKPTTRDGFGITDVPKTDGTGAAGTWGINISGNAAYATTAGSAPANGGTAAAVTINYSNDSNSTYQMLWGSGTGVYGTSGIYCNPSTDYLYAASHYSSGWFRQTNQCGVYNETYGRGYTIADGSFSYGNIGCYGAGLNSWYGYGIYPGNAVLMANGSNCGLYNPAGGVWMMISDMSGNTTFAGNVTAYSDLRLKANVREIDNVIERRNTLAMSAIKYERDGRTRIGYGAQTLRDNGCAEFVIEADDSVKMVTGLGTLSVDYGETAAVLAVVSKMTDDRVLVLEEQVRQLTARIESLLERN